MRALRDADLLVYEVAFGAENRKEDIIYSFESLIPRLEKKIADILDEVGATSHTLYLTGKGNFREEIAVTKEYKGNRGAKPYHHANVRAYLESLGAVVVDGMEADDVMAIEQTSDWIMLRGSKDNEEQHSKVCTTVICSRDKDLRQVPGWHYGWEAHNQPEYAMKWTSELGHLELTDKRKVKGDGLKFFYAQLIMGDKTDNIQGIEGKGDVFAYSLLEDCTDEQEMSMLVRKAYDDDVLVLEMGRLLWMTRELDKEGKPILWEIYDG